MAAPIKRMFAKCYFPCRRQNTSIFAACIHSNNRLQSIIKINHNIELDPLLIATVEKNPAYKPKFKRHPGRKNTVKILPTVLLKAIESLMQEFNKTDLKKHCNVFLNQFHSRGLQIEHADFERKVKEAEEFFEEKDGPLNLEGKSEELTQTLLSRRKSKILNRLKKHIYHWKPSLYDDSYRCLTYMAARMPIEYITLHNIFSEILQRDPDFIPQVMFDFGSGVGSAVWSANDVWPQCLSEHYCVDISDPMNSIAQQLMQDKTSEQGGLHFKGVFFKQFLPTSEESNYDLVVGAFSLIEIPTKEERLKIVNRLWKKTKDYLVIVENGTNAGFQIISEVRQSVLESIGEHEERGHIFSPCPHSLSCPRFTMSNQPPCNFEAVCSESNLVVKPSGQKSRYSYIVFKKGARPEEPIWPRVVKPKKRSSGQVILSVCSTQGVIESMIFTIKKDGRMLHKYAQACEWGDRIPVVERDSNKYLQENSEGSTETTCIESDQADERIPSCESEAVRRLLHSQGNLSAEERYNYRMEKLLKTEQVDEKYVEQRITNNISVRKSRTKSRLKRQEMLDRITKLRQDNETLEKTANQLSEEINVLQISLQSHSDGNTTETINDNKKYSNIDQPFLDPSTSLS